ncbi:MAG: hypothetical protein IMF26_01625 [Candidatus Fermentithermobacillus carboniphilus]|uniref:YmaF family protein n=1 Tax=Candidatus Fermentithermobacillus carboniphilus TaxID=3085328 RepID=A0AAT9LE19_9FIRM|nr:MAG: hypothetical protein IMF26_01625 [Candidatus Fermentithermobacillus carboniphilus]
MGSAPDEVKSKEVTAPEAGHVHDYWGRTSTEQDHFHTFEGTTGLDTPVDGDHVHRFANETSRAHGHTHRMAGTTSHQIPAFPGHVHRIQGLTTFDEGHAHTFDVQSSHPHRPRTRRPRLAGVQEKPDEPERSRRALLRISLRKPRPSETKR